MTPSPGDTATLQPPPQFELPMTPLRRVRARGPIRGRLAMLGPAFVAAVAYIDPGNFATNFESGAKFGYKLVWVIVMANLMAVLVQYLSAKAGVASGAASPSSAARPFRGPPTSSSGSRRRSSRSPPTSPSSSGRRSASTSSSGSRCSPRA